MGNKYLLSQSNKNREFVADRPALPEILKVLSREKNYIGQKLGSQ